MPGFSIGGTRRSALWADRNDVRGEPVFVYIHEQDGTPGLVSMDYMADIAHDLHAGDREGWGFRQLFVMIPGEDMAHPCAASLTSSEGRLKMVFHLDNSPARNLTVDIG